MLIKVTEKGATTRLTKLEMTKMKQVRKILEVLGDHCPTVGEYREAAKSLTVALEILDGEHEQQPTTTR